MNKDGEFILTSEAHRTQELNKGECIKKLYNLILMASHEEAETSEEQKSSCQSFGT